MPHCSICVGSGLSRDDAPCPPCDGTGIVGGARAVAERVMLRAWHFHRAFLTGSGDPLTAEGFAPRSPDPVDVRSTAVYAGRSWPRQVSIDARFSGAERYTDGRPPAAELLASAPRVILAVDFRLPEARTVVAVDLTAWRSGVARVTVDHGVATIDADPEVTRAILWLASLVNPGWRYDGRPRR